MESAGYEEWLTMGTGHLCGVTKSSRISGDGGKTEKTKTH